MTFDASFDCEQFFSRNAGIRQKLPKTFCPVGETIRVNWASWCSTDCLEKQLRAFQVTLGRRLFVRIRCSWTSIFFSIVSGLCLILLLLSSPGKLPQVCVCHHPSASPECPCHFGVAPKTLQLNFLRLFNEKTGLFRKIFVSGLVVLYSAHNCQLLEPRCSETAFAKQRLSLTFERKKPFSQLSFVWS